MYFAAKGTSTNQKVSIHRSCLPILRLLIYCYHFCMAIQSHHKSTNSILYASHYMNSRFSMEKSGATTRKNLIASVLNCSQSGKASLPIQHSHRLLALVGSDRLVPRGPQLPSRAFRAEGHSTIHISAVTGTETEKGTEIVSLSVTANGKYEIESETKNASVLQITVIPNVSN